MDLWGGIFWVWGLFVVMKKVVSGGLVVFRIWWDWCVVYDCVFGFVCGFG